MTDSIQQRVETIMYHKIPLNLFRVGLRNPNMKNYFLSSSSSSSLSTVSCKENKEKSIAQAMHHHNSSNLISSFHQKGISKQRHFEDGLYSPLSFPPTPASRLKVIKKQSSELESLIFTSRDKLRLESRILTKEHDIHSRRVAEEVKRSGTFISFDPRYHSESIALSCGNHRLQKCGSSACGSGRSTLPVPFNVYVYVEFEVHINHGLSSSSESSSSSEPAFAIGLVPPDCPVNAFVGKWPRSVGLSSDSCLFLGGSLGVYSTSTHDSLTEPTIADGKETHIVTVGLLLCIPDESELDDGGIVGRKEEDGMILDRLGGDKVMGYDRKQKEGKDVTVLHYEHRGDGDGDEGEEGDDEGEDEIVRRNLEAGGSRVGGMYSRGRSEKQVHRSGNNHGHRHSHRRVHLPGHSNSLFSFFSGLFQFHQNTRPTWVSSHGRVGSVLDTSRRTGDSDNGWRWRESEDEHEVDDDRVSYKSLSSTNESQSDMYHSENLESRLRRLSLSDEEGVAGGEARVKEDEDYVVGMDLAAEGDSETSVNTRIKPVSLRELEDSNGDCVGGVERLLIRDSISVVSSLSSSDKTSSVKSRYNPHRFCLQYNICGELMSFPLDINTLQVELTDMKAPLYPAVSLLSNDVSVQCKFSADDVRYRDRQRIGAPAGVPVYALDGTVLIPTDT